LLGLEEVRVLWVDLDDFHAAIAPALLIAFGGVQ
jgi:hypothetical protein